MPNSKYVSHSPSASICNIQKPEWIHTFSGHWSPNQSPGMGLGNLTSIFPAFILGAGKKRWTRWSLNIVCCWILKSRNRAAAIYPTVPMMAMRVIIELLGRKIRETIFTKQKNIDDPKLAVSVKKWRLEEKTGQYSDKFLPALGPTPPLATILTSTHPRAQNWGQPSLLVRYGE